jgi:molecular chaperone DnaJ
VETPVKLSSKQKEMLRELDDSLKGSGKHNPQHHSWLDGVKKFFTE